MPKIIKDILRKSFKIFIKVFRKTKLILEKKKFIKSIKKTNHKVAIFDIDNTIADTWPKFISSINNLDAWKTVKIFDGVKKIIVDYISNDYKIYFLSARPLKVKNLTREWLEKNGLPTDNLYLTEEAVFKISFLKDINKKICYYDDLSSKTETGKTEFYDDVIRFVKNKPNITYYDYYYILEYQWMVL
jgi:phosphatidate phosphatase PAH1